MIECGGFWMQDEILHSLRRIEEEEKIQIHFACESGSRAWGTQAAASDFDVRFIYSHKINWYLQIYEGRDVIETSNHPKVDLVGWDLKKSLRLLQKSNPTLLEWINSPITYIRNDPFITELKKLAMLAFSPTPTGFHYLNMAKKNNQLLQKNQDFTTKRYLNILRPLFTCLWILEYKEMPFIEDVSSLFHHFLQDQAILKHVDDLLQAKKEGQNLFHSELINLYIEKTIPFIEEKVKKLKHPKLDMTNDLNQFFLKTLNNPTSNHH